MEQAGESATAAAIAAMLMAGCAHGRGVRSERQEACKDMSPCHTDVFSPLSNTQPPISHIFS